MLMELVDVVDLEELQKMQDMFALATGMAAVTVDLKGNYVTKPSNFTDFCMDYTRKSTLGANRCAKCDAEGEGAYFCHAGLMDFAEPIVVNGEHLGNILGGQVLPKEPDIAQFEAIAEELSIPKEDYIKALKKVTVRSEESIRAASQMLRELVTYLVNFQYALKKDEEKISVLKIELKNMIAHTEDITEKVKELEKISSRQNILSLNASIEAARAGEAGRGFAIVANQMGDLAKDSSKIYSSIIQDAGEIHTSVTNLDSTFEEQ